MWLKRPLASNWNPCPEEVATARSVTSKGRIDILRILEVGKADAPRLSVGPRTDGAVLAHVDEAAGDTGLTQEGDDAIGHITLGDAIECQDHDR